MIEVIIEGPSSGLEADQLVRGGAPMYEVPVQPVGRGNLLRLRAAQADRGPTGHPARFTRIARP
jgi:hypothetical protein